VVLNFSGLLKMLLIRWVEWILTSPRLFNDPKYPDDHGGSLVLDIPAGDVHMDGHDRPSCMPRHPAIRIATLAGCVVNKQ